MSPFDVSRNVRLPKEKVEEIYSFRDKTKYGLKLSKVICIVLFFYADVINLLHWHCGLSEMHLLTV